MSADEGAPGDVYEIVFDEAKRGLEQQSSVFNDLRGRAGTVLGAASIAASFLGGIALDDKRIGPWGVAAIIAFVLVAIGTLVVLLPYTWRSTLSSDILIDDWIGGNPPADALAMRRELARVMWRNQEANQQTLNGLWWVYGATIALLAAMVFLWLAELGGFLGVA